jgi:hypothetical protein
MGLHPALVSPGWHCHDKTRPFPMFICKRHFMHWPTLRRYSQRRSLRECLLARRTGDRLRPPTGRRRDHRPPSKLPSNRLICGADFSARRVMAHQRPADGEQANASSYGCPAISGPYRNTALQFPTPHRVATHVGEPSCLWRPRSATSANSRKCAVLNIRR